MIGMCLDAFMSVEITRWKTYLLSDCLADVWMCEGRQWYQR